MSNIVKKEYTKAALKSFEIMSLCEKINATLHKMENKQDGGAVYQKYYDGASDVRAAAQKLLELIEAKKEDIF